jgi:hypothetical protein
VESLAAMASISAHETTPGHAFSTADFMLSMTSNPLAEFWFGAAFFSPVKEDVSSSKSDPSHPCHTYQDDTKVRRCLFLTRKPCMWHCIN